MIGIDTNVVLRWLVGDDSGQLRKANAVMDDAPDDLFVNVVVLAEAAWVLRRVYRAERRVIASGLRSLVEHPRVVLDQRSAVDEALSAYETGGAGLSDLLIGALNTAAGCRTTLTFDKAAAKGRHFTAIA